VNAQLRATKENRRNARVFLEQPLKVIMGSIGADVRYELMTRNLSVTGFFLDFDKPGRFPFTPASIMEIWLELGKDETIFFNGKMARVVHPDELDSDGIGPGIAVKIVQIDTENERILKDFVKNNSLKSFDNEEEVA